jgi:hypothetical protein
MHWVEEVGEENDVGVGPQVVEELPARLQDRSEQVPAPTIKLTIKTDKNLKNKYKK